MIVTTAFWFSVLMVAYWSFWNFHRPYHPDTIRFSVRPRRYLLGIALYGGAALTVFFIVLLAGRLVVKFLWPEMSDEAHTGLPLGIALIVTILLPRLPFSGDLEKGVRLIIQHAALFPGEVDRLTLELQKSKRARDVEVCDQMRKDLSVFALDPAAIDRVFPAEAIRPLEEVQELRVRVLGALEGPHFKDFLDARHRVIKEVALDHQRLLRRMARATLLAEELQKVPPPSSARDDDEPLGVETLSQFIREESNAVAARFHRLAAEAALSNFFRWERGADFLEGVGYARPAKWERPYWPFVGVILVLPATALLFWVMPFIWALASLVGQAFGFDTSAGPSPPPRNRIAFGLFFSILQLIVALWAVVPKALTRWAWPRFQSRMRSKARRRSWRWGWSVLALPLGSYVVSGVGAFLSQATLGVLLILSLGSERPTPFGISSMKLMLVTSIFSFLSTVSLCFLIDRRLLDRSFSSLSRRSLDGCFLAVAMMVADQMCVQQIIEALGGTAPGFRPTVSMGALGFMLGFIVPGGVADWINSRMAEILRYDGKSTVLPNEPAVGMLDGVDLTPRQSLAAAAARSSPGRAA